MSNPVCPKTGAPMQRDARPMTLECFCRLRLDDEPAATAAGHPATA